MAGNKRKEQSQSHKQAKNERGIISNKYTIVDRRTKKVINDVHLFLQIVHLFEDAMSDWDALSWIEKKTLMVSVSFLKQWKKGHACACHLFE
jgi:hypothetical protein